MYEEKEKSFFRFEDLRVYDKALDYVEWVIGATDSFPENKGRVLSSRINHAALKVATHIAEGSARKKPQFVLNLKMAKSMVRECIVYTSVMDKEGYVGEEEIEVSRTHLMELTKMIGALIGSLQRKTNGNGYRNHDNTDDGAIKGYGQRSYEEKNEEYSKKEEVSVASDDNYEEEDLSQSI